MRWIERESFPYPRRNPERGYPRRTLYWKTARRFPRRGFRMRVYKLEIAGASLCGFINGPGEPWELWDTVAHRWAGFASEGLDWMTPCSRVEAEAIRRQRAVK